jgi:polyhydroxyalkanoate synthesis regulator phasin
LEARRVDADLKAYLEATEQRNAERFDAIAQRMATKADLDAMRQEAAERFTTVQAGVRVLDTKIDTLMERVDKGFAARKEDEDTALREIDVLKGRVTRLETRVRVLEQRKP